MAKTKKVVIPVAGMHCANCALTIEKAVSKVSGVQSANVNFASEKLSAEFDSEMCSEKEIVDAVNKTGYKALVEKTPIPAHPEMNHSMGSPQHAAMEKKEEPFDSHAHAHMLEEKD